MNKKDLIDAVSEKSELSRKDAANAVDGFLSGLTSALAAGDTVTLVGFGTFGVRTRAARVGKNPLTGAALNIPEKVVPSFKPGKSLKTAVN